MDSNANTKKPLRARKTMSPGCRKQVEMLRKIHGRRKDRSNSDSLDKYMPLRMAGTVLSPYRNTNPSRALGETNSGDLPRSFPCNMNSEEEQFFNARSLQDMLYTLYENTPQTPVFRPVEVRLFSGGGDQPLGDSEEETSTLASPAGNFSALSEAEERSGQIAGNQAVASEALPGNHAVAHEAVPGNHAVAHEALPDTLRKRKPSGCEKDVTSEPGKSDDTAEDSKRRKTSQEVATDKRLEPSGEITDGSAAQLEKSQSAIDRVQCFIRHEIEHLVGNLDQKVQQLNERLNTQSQREDSQIAVQIAKKVAKLERRINSWMPIQQAEQVNTANCPGATAKTTILNAAKPVSGIPDNSAVVPPSRPLEQAPPTTAQSTAKESTPVLTAGASGFQAGSSTGQLCTRISPPSWTPDHYGQRAKGVQRKRPSVDASADIPHTTENLVFDLTEEDGDEASVNLSPPAESIGPKLFQPATESSEIPASFSHLPPLPRTRLAPEHMKDFPNSLPPQKLEMAVVQVQNPKGIALQWNVNQLDPRCAPIKSFLLFMCHERTDRSTTPWIKIKEIEALPLPMACSLSKFSSPGKCYFIMQSKDIFGRFGPFCDIQAIFAA